MTTEIRDLIENRLTELKDEADRLKRAIEALGPRSTEGNVSGSRAERRSSKSPRRAKNKRAGRGQRQRQLIKTIEAMPAAAPPELGKAIGVSSTQVHSMIRSLEGKDKIRRTRQGFEVVGQP